MRAVKNFELGKMPKRRRESDESEDEVYDDGMTNSVFEYKMDVTEDMFPIPADFRFRNINTGV